VSLAIQDYLRSGKTPDDLQAELGVNYYRHPELPLVGFKYSQIDSPKTNPVVRDARGIVLEDGSWDVVAKPFRRFFNAGEDAEAFRRFNWSDFTCTTKEDGSLKVVYNYQGRWYVNTSGSFGLFQCGESGLTWAELFWKTSGIDESKLDPELTYVCEMWTPHNKVVRIYPRPTVFLLSAFVLPTLAEVSVEEADRLAAHVGLTRPEHHHFTSMDEIAAFLEQKSAKDKTYEGVVIRDAADERYKVKSDTYVALHHLKDNGNVCRSDRLVPLVLAGESDEVLAYLPEIEPYLREVQARMDEEYANLLALWRETKDIASQKEFALSIVPRTAFAGVLFNVRKIHGEDQAEEHLKGMWRKSGDLIVKHLFKGAG
jgi:hypothetical protein